MSTEKDGEASSFGQMTGVSGWRVKRKEKQTELIGRLVGRHGWHQRKWWENLLSEVEQRSTGLKKEHFICGQWSSLQRLSLAYLTRLCPLLCPASLCYLTVVTLWFHFALLVITLRYRNHKSTCTRVSPIIPCEDSPGSSETNLSQCVWLSSEAPEGRSRCSPECSCFSVGVDDAPERHMEDTGSRSCQHGVLNATSKQLMHRKNWLTEEVICPVLKCEHLFTFSSRLF